MCLRFGGTVKSKLIALCVLGLVSLIGVDALGGVQTGPQTVSAEALFEDGWTAYNLQKYGDAMGLFRRAADKGSPKAEYQIGEMYALARGVPEDMTQAMVWYSRAANQGLPEAQVAVGTLYSNGWGVPQDKAKALTWYRKAANQNDAIAQSFVGIAYVNGLGVEPDFAEAKIWLGRAIDGGVADAVSFLCPPYEAAWIEASMSKNVTQMDQVIAKIDAHCTALIRRASMERGRADK